MSDKKIALQIGMHVKIIDDKIGFPTSYAKTLKVTNYQKDFNGKKAFTLDNREDDIFLIEDFEYCIEYPDFKII